MKKEKLIIANWKMQLSLAETHKLVLEIKNKFENFNSGRIVLCPDFISILGAKKNLQGSPISIGAQDSFWEQKGAYTGEISPRLLVEAGCEYVILGHSERRQFLLENYELINKELEAVLQTGKLIPIICIGETTQDKKNGVRDKILFEQLRQVFAGVELVKDQQIIIAYEPIWAIGTGDVITSQDAAYAHKIIRLTINDMFGMHEANHNFRIIYGGSVKTDNVHEFLGIENIDGFLVGGDSLDADKFFKIAKIFTK